MVCTIDWLLLLGRRVIMALLHHLKYELK